MNSHLVGLCSDCSRGSLAEGLPGHYRCNFFGTKSTNLPSHCSYYEGLQTSIDIIIITAVDIERNAVLNYLHPDGKDAWDTLTTEIDGLWRTCTYKSSEDSGTTVRIALAKTREMGLSASASLTALAIQLFRPSYVVMLGIAAGREGKTSIGDVVVPLEVWDYGAGKWEEHNGKTKFQPRINPRPIHETVRQSCESLSSKEEVKHRIRNDWLGHHPDKSAPMPPNIHIEPMVSGAAVVDTQAIWDHILDQNDKVIALDMEAYAVAFATHSACTAHYHPLCFIAKAICDYGVKKQDSDQAYAAYTSTRFFKYYLEEFVMGRDLKNSPYRMNVPLGRPR